MYRIHKHFQILMVSWDMTHGVYIRYMHLMWSVCFAVLSMESPGFRFLADIPFQKCVMDD